MAKTGRPQKVIPHIPDTFENVIKALVRPVKEREGVIQSVAVPEDSGVEPQRQR